MKTYLPLLSLALLLSPSAAAMVQTTASVPATAQTGAPASASAARSNAQAQVAAAAAQRDIVSTREMDRINWMEFREVVPARVQTVLLPTGTLEPHGVANNGADNTAPTAMARHIARRENHQVGRRRAYERNR